MNKNKLKIQMTTIIKKPDTVPRRTKFDVCELLEQGGGINDRTNTRIHHANDYAWGGKGSKGKPRCMRMCQRVITFLEPSAGCCLSASFVRTLSPVSLSPCQGRDSGVHFTPHTRHTEKRLYEPERSSTHLWCDAMCFAKPP